MPGALTVGELAVELEARTREFTRRMGGAEKRIQRFEGQATKSTKAAGLGFRRLLAPIAAVAGALAGIRIARGFINLGQAAVQNAAAFEGYEVRLKALLGSQEGANRALETFVTLSARTPFGISQIVGGAATLASVARGSRTELEDLTQVTANLAAVTGLKFEEAAGNLQRALAAGIGAADLFRDRGVRKLIEEVNNIPDLTKVSLDELRELFKKTFEPGAASGFGDAAVDLSETLGGALSNISDAAERMRIALGRALSPAVIATARAVIIPFFDELTVNIKDNEDALARFFIQGFAKGVEVMAKAVEMLGPLGEGFIKAVRWVRDLKDEAKIAFEAIMLFVGAMSTGFKVLGTGLNAIGTGLRVVAHLLGLRTAEEVEEQFLALNDSVNATVDSAIGLRKAMENFGKEAPKDVEETTSAFDKLAERLRQGAEGIRQIGEDQIRLQKQRAAASDEAAAAALRERMQVLGMLSQIEDEFEEIAREHRAWEIQIALDQQAAAAAAETAREQLSGTLQGVLEDLLAGEGLDFADLFAQQVADRFTASMSEALVDFGESLSTVLENAFAGLGESLGGLFSETNVGQWFSELGGAGGIDWGAGLQAGVGLGSQVLSGALRGTQANVRGDLVRSVVTSTQEVRGLVAGPTNIPIAQVGDAIRDSFQGQLVELRRSNVLLGSILQAIRGLDLTGGETGDALAAVIAQEFNGSVALG